MKQTVECSVYREKMVDYQKFAFILLCLGVFLFLGTILGLYGLLCGVLFLIMYLVKLKSFGKYYISKVISFNLKDSN